MSQSTSEPANPRAEPPELTESDRHRLLAARRRRVVLDVLEHPTPPVELEAVATAVAGRETDLEGSPSDVDRVAISLHHQHLPMMADAGVIEYDPTSKRVETVHPTPDLS